MKGPFAEDNSDNAFEAVGIEGVGAFGAERLKGEGAPTCDRWSLRLTIFGSHRWHR